MQQTSYKWSDRDGQTITTYENEETKNILLINFKQLRINNNYETITK